MTARIDPRSRRSKRALQRAFMSLVVERGLAATTVEDVAARAKLGRTTFYLHYGDKNEIMLECIAAIIDKLQAEFVPVAQDPARLERGDLIRMTFEHVAAHADLYRFATHSDVAAKVNDLIIDKSVAFIRHLLEPASSGSAPAMPTELVAHHISGSLLAAIRWWLDRGQAYSAADMATLHFALITKGVEALYDA